MPPRTRNRPRYNNTPREAPPRNDVYVGLLIISLLAMIAGTVLLFLDYSAYAEKPKDLPPRPAASAAPGGGVPAPGAFPPGGGPPPAPGIPPAPMGGMPPAPPQ